MINGRVIGIDYKMYGRSYCAIATYVPHCGYSNADFDETYNQLRCIASKAYRSCKRIIIGGDFNTQFDIGIRGVALRQFAKEFGLCITNTTDSDTSTNWTVESSMGVRRKLDFILASRSLLVIESGLSDKLDLGSDHRAVQTTRPPVSWRPSGHCHLLRARRLRCLGECARSSLFSPTDGGPIRGRP